MNEDQGQTHRNKLPQEAVAHADQSDHLSVSLNPRIAGIIIETVREVLDPHRVDQLLVPIANSHLQKVLELKTHATAPVS